MFVHGSVMMEAATKDELWDIFEKGSENRHVASTSKNKGIPYCDSSAVFLY